MNLGLNGKTAIVFASSKGLGKAIATKFAVEGANVVITSRSEETLKNTALEIKEQAKNENVMYKVCDLTDSNSIKDVFHAAIEEFGSVDILINNAGGPPAGSFKDFEDKDWQYAFELNLLSFVRCIREAIPYMKSKQWGRIVNIASSSIKEPIDGLILSNTFRTGVMGLAKSLATELGEDQILINTIGPGRIQTDRINELEEAASKKIGITQSELKEAMKKTIPLGRYGDPEELANLAVFLCSEANSYVTGQSILVDGGKTKAL